MIPSDRFAVVRPLDLDRVIALQHRASHGDGIAPIRRFLADYERHDLGGNYGSGLNYSPIPFPLSSGSKPLSAIPRRISVSLVLSLISLTHNSATKNRVTFGISKPSRNAIGSTYSLSLNLKA